MRAWRRYNKHYHWYWCWALAIRRLADHSLAFILAKGKNVRFERKRNVQLKRAMQLVQVEDMVATMSASSEMQAGTNYQSLSQGL